MLEINLRAVRKRKDVESVVCSRNNAVETTLKKNKERRRNGEEKKDIERERERERETKSGVQARIKEVLDGATAPGFVCSEKYVSLRKIRSILRVYVISRKMKKIRAF